MPWQHMLKARWSTLAPREQRSLVLATVVVSAALIWAVLIAPAWRTLQTADAQSAALSAEMERMQTLQARAGQIRSKPAVAPQDALHSIQSTVAVLGKSATLQVLGEQVTLTLKQVSADDLAGWLSALAESGLGPVEAHLQRDSSVATPQWSGTVVFRLSGSVATQ